jgi:hypothetical protein
MADDVNRDRPAVRHADLVSIDIEDFAVIDAFVTESLWIRHVWFLR